VLKPVVGAGCFLMAARIPLTWFPDEKSKEFPFNLIVAPTEPLLKPTRETIPPFQGLDVSPIVWFAILSFLNEIFLGPQGLLILLQNKV
jgi:YggT family protein